MNVVFNSQHLECLELGWPVTTSFMTAMCNVYCSSTPMANAGSGGRYPARFGICKNM
jgi:hypothetical protein